MTAFEFLYPRGCACVCMGGIFQRRRHLHHTSYTTVAYKALIVRLFLSHIIKSLLNKQMTGSHLFQFEVCQSAARCAKNKKCKSDHVQSLNLSWSFPKNISQATETVLDGNIIQIMFEHCITEKGFPKHITIMHNKQSRWCQQIFSGESARDDGKGALFVLKGVAFDFAV